MNYADFYEKTQNRLKESVLSVWATGDEEMQRYFSTVLDREKLLAEPVFQTAFPWEPSGISFEQANMIFSDSFIRALDIVPNPLYRFAKSRIPYRHQIESWEASLNKEQSIAVTTGTGSGKTECFMLPVLQDIYTNCRNTTGVNAIFLYPLNALIGSQKKRIDAWCRSLGGIKYAVYNRNTDESAPPKKIADSRLPELVSREQIRNTPPNILFTNPSMLEYILVRNKDVPLLEKSKGTLRWILLDEAHTLTGSAAAEMALLIRRVIDAFQADRSKLRFAITSATVGNDPRNESQIKKFMSTLCGIPETAIRVITGNRVLPQVLAETDVQAAGFPAAVAEPFPEKFSQVSKLRHILLEKPAVSAGEIGALFNTRKLEEQLALVDHLSNRVVGDASILPVRGHFFARGIGGVYVCTNPACGKHQTVLPAMAAGTMTTIAGRRCECGWTMLELVSCEECGKQLLEGEMITDRGTGQGRIRMAAAETEDHFSIEGLEDDEPNNQMNIAHAKFYFARNTVDTIFKLDAASFALCQDGIVQRNESFFIELHNGACCPHCGKEAANAFHFRLSSAFMNRVLADIFLEETPAAEVQTGQMLWNGRKYISFTDSRQGTAKISALINQDTEGKWVRAQIYHKLWEKNVRHFAEHPGIPTDELQSIISQLEQDLQNTHIPALRKNRERDLATYRAQLNQSDVPFAPETLSWQEVKDYLRTLKQFNALFHGNNPHDSDSRSRELYLSAILYDQFGRRIPRQNSLENLGMISLVYPELQQATNPTFSGAFAMTDTEWRSLLKIGADYVLRYHFHTVIDLAIKSYTTRITHSTAIYDSDATEVNVTRWPVFNRHQSQVNRMALLICAGLGFHDRDAIDAATEDGINEVLQRLWRDLKKVLFREENFFKLNLEEKTRFALTHSAWLCPARKRVLDAHFRGYSPWMKGALEAENITRYKITKALRMPPFPYPFNLDNENNVSIQPTIEWLRTETTALRQQGIWNNLHEQVILNRPVFLSGEHSAQQHEDRLKNLEGQFEDGEINILNCSTTMEMGVDIGGISTVVMNNVPPRPANYQQRAGRAGRRSEAQSLAFTICAPNPIGMSAMDNPKWAMEHPIAPPFLSFQSDSVAERHVNAFFLGKFVQTDAIKGINIRMSTEAFFLSQNQPVAQGLSTWLLGSGPTAHNHTLDIIVCDTPLAGKSFMYLLNGMIRRFQAISDSTFRKNDRFLVLLEKLKAEFTEESPAWKSVHFQYRQFLDKNAIGYMAENGFLPAAGLPTGVVEFDTLNIDDLKKKRTKKPKPSYFITRALSEFAPGREIVIDGRSYVSEGIIMEDQMGTQAERQVIQSCTNCGYQRLIDVEADRDIHAVCPHCQQQSFRGIKFQDSQLRGASYTELIQPAGFATDLYELPHRKIKENSFVEYIDPILVNIRPWQNENTALFDIRESGDNAQILFYNMGAGNGYSVCLHCGRTAFERDSLIGHKRLRGGKTNDNDRNAVCSGNDAAHAIHNHVLLGGRFKTDFAEIRFRDEHNLYSGDTELLYTLGAIFSKELALYLAVEQGEINFGIKRYEGYSTVFIFDTIKGGAGYSSQFRLYAAEIFASAKRKLEACDCEVACTKCLIDRSTQWHMEDLNKQAALRWLTRALNRTVPAPLANAYPGLTTVIGGIQDEIGRLSYVGKIKKLRLYVSPQIDQWDTERLAFLEKLKGSVLIDLAIDTDKPFFNVQEKITLIQVKYWADLFRADKVASEPLQTLCKVETTDGKVVTYLAEDYHAAVNEGWGNTSTGIVYKLEHSIFEPLRQLELPIDERTMAEGIIDTRDPVESNKVADLLLEALGDKLPLREAMNNQSFYATYSDAYLKSPLGCLLMLQMVDRLQTLLGFTVTGLAFHGKDFFETSSPQRIYHNFMTGEDRKNALVRMATRFNFEAEVTNKTDLPHFRSLTFSSQRVRVIIRPDAGIGHGWYCDTTRISNRDLYYRGPDAMPETVTVVNQSNMGILYTVSIEILE